MAILDKKSTLYARDDKGTLIAEEVELLVDEKVEEQLAYKGQTIKIVPLTRAEIKVMFATTTVENEKDVDGELIVKHCKDPSYTIEEVAHLKPVFSTLLVNTILAESGLDIGGKSRKKQLEIKKTSLQKIKKD